MSQIIKLQNPSTWLPKKTPGWLHRYPGKFVYRVWQKHFIYCQVWIRTETSCISKNRDVRGTILPWTAAWNYSFKSSMAQKLVGQSSIPQNPIYSSCGVSFEVIPVCQITPLEVGLCHIAGFTRNRCETGDPTWLKLRGPDSQRDYITFPISKKRKSIFPKRIDYLHLFSITCTSLSLRHFLNIMYVIRNVFIPKKVVPLIRRTIYLTPFSSILILNGF